MGKHENYQRLLEEGEVKTKDSLIYKLSAKFKWLERKYWELSRIGFYGIKNIPNLKTASSILEIGCGSGAAMSYIKKFYNNEAKFYGVDLDRNSFLPDWVEFFKVDIDKEKIPLPDNSVDVVISIFVLEHLYNPQNLMKEAFRVLKNGGSLYLVTENYTSIFVPSGKFNFYNDFTHIRPWSKKSLKDLSLSCGFRIINVKILRPVEYLFFIPSLPIIGIINPENYFLFYRFLFGSAISVNVIKG